jgi:hypothetical protein
VRAVEGGLDPLFAKAKERIAGELNRVLEKTGAAIGQREGAGANRVKYLSALVSPRGRLQERTLAVAPFMLDEPERPAELLSVAEIPANGHRIITLE